MDNLDVNRRSSVSSRHSHSHSEWENSVIEETLSIQPSKIWGFTKRQWLTIAVLAFTDLFSSVKVSLQAPFYPQEAEKKGATATEYGFVFGVFELTTFIMSPVYGLIMRRIGPKLMFKTGVYVAGLSSIAFGFLDRIDDKKLFIGLSFAIRIIESLGATAANTSSFTIIAMEFPQSVASTFAFLETFFGLGLILGPTIGGALFEIGGFTLPFVVMGGMLFMSAVFASFILPANPPEPPLIAINDDDEGLVQSSVEDQEDLERNLPTNDGFHIFKLLRIPGVFLSCFGTMATSLSIGFISGTLEPHIRGFGLTPFLTGAFFIISGLNYAISAPFWGKLCDKVEDPKFITVIGSIFIIIGFSFLGPLPFLPFNTTIWLAGIGLFFHGMGIGAAIPSSFVAGLHDAKNNGLPDNVSTYGLISGLWVSMFSLGAFIGPSVGGILYDQIGFRLGSLFVIGSQLILVILLVSFIWRKKRSKKLTELNKRNNNQPNNGSETDSLLRGNSSENNLNPSTDTDTYGSTIITTNNP